MKYHIGLSILLLCATGCGSLAPGAEGVNVTRDPTAVLGCRVLGPVSFVRQPYRSYTKQMTNTVFAMGGDTVFITSAIDASEGVAYKCSDTDLRVITNTQERVLAKRKADVQDLQDKLRSEGMLVDITVTGKDNSTLRIENRGPNTVKWNCSAFDTTFLYKLALSGFEFLECLDGRTPLKRYNLSRTKGIPPVPK